MPFHNQGTSRYPRGEPLVRLQPRVTASLVKKIDAFGISTGFKSRNAAVVYLIETALKTEETSGSVAKLSPNASAEKENGHDAV